MAAYQLKEEIIELSSSHSWNDARLEWKLFQVCRVEEIQACLCGHTPIKELWLIQNQKTRHKATVGNRCVRRFLAMESEKQFAAFRRVNLDNNRSFDVDTIQMANRYDWINSYETDLYISLIRKRKVDEEQAKWKRSINLAIIEKLLQQVTCQVAPCY